MKNRLITKLLLSVIFLLLSLILIKNDNNLKEKYDQLFFTNSFSFNRFNNWYTTHFGNFLPGKNIAVLSSASQNIYTEYSEYYDGVKFQVSNNTPISALKGGLVVYKGDDNVYGKIIVIQGIDGYDYWYGNITNSDLSLYDYINTGDILGESLGDYFYLLLKKNNQIVKYEDYKI